MNIRIEYEGKKTMDEVAKNFKYQLSGHEIKKGAATAINYIITRSSSRLRKKVKSVYTVKHKFLMKAMKIKKRATVNSLEGMLAYDTNPIPIIGFKAKNMDRMRFYGYEPKYSASVEIKKGETKTIGQAFIKPMPNGHTGVYMHGKYGKSGFERSYMLTSNKKMRITELKTASPFSMMSSDAVRNDLYGFINKNLADRYHAILQNKINKIR